jgi:hypothetical protein
MKDCKNCVHFRKRENVIPYCVRKKSDKGYRYCGVERESGECGKDGKFYQERSQIEDAWD